MPPELPSDTRPPRESERERLSRVLRELPESLQGAARAIGTSVPAVKDIVIGDPHKPLQSAVGRIRDALRPGQS